MKINKNMKIKDLLVCKPEAAKLLFSRGVMCVGCPMANQETIEQGLKAHGFTDKEISKLIEEMNKE
jgi:hybrid cluster-associated redox disulfide protein